MPTESKPIDLKTAAVIAVASLAVAVGISPNEEPAAPIVPPVVVEQPDRVVRSVVTPGRQELARKYLTGEPMTFQEYQDFVDALDQRLRETGGVRISDVHSQSDLKIAFFNLFTQ
jgi:hypothetical protein